MIGVYERNSKLYIEVAPDSEAHEHGLAVGEHRIPSRRVICAHCTGVGVVAYQPTEADTADPDFMADVGNGFYDTTCNECSGEGSVVEVNKKRLALNPALHAHFQAQGGW